MNNGEHKSKLKPVVKSVAAALFAMQSLNVQAATFELGDFEISFDSTFSAGTSFRIEDRNMNALVGKSNNQTFDWSGYVGYAPKYPNTQVWGSYGSYSTNGDLGNLNYDPGEAFSQVVKGFHELKINADNYGAVVSFMYYKDFAAEGVGYADPVLRDSNGNMVKFDPCRDDKAKELVCEDFRILDAYLYADFDFNDGLNPVSVRIGEQVLSWGESTVIPHGINVTPVDIARLKAPGSDLKEAFIPVGMVWANVGITENLSLEAFYQYEWQQTYLPVPGSYFSTNDFVGAGGQHLGIQLNFASNPDMGADGVMAGVDSIGQMLAGGLIDSETAANMYIGGYASKYAVRASNQDQEASDEGQFGIKLGYFSEDLNYTDFGFYYINYHSRRPLISGKSSDFSAGAIGQDLQTIVMAQANGGLSQEQYSNLNAFTKGIIEFPEDIKLYGFSFNTTVGTTAVSGEVSYRQDEPIQIDDTELLFAAMPEQLANAGLRPELDGISLLGDYQVEGCNIPAGGVQLGETASGYCLVDTVQAQMTMTHMFGPMLGFSNVALVGEVGHITILDMADPSEMRFNAPGTPRSGSTSDEVAGGLLAAVQHGEDTEQYFPTDTAWGYRAILVGEVNGVFGGAFNLKPKVIYSHDVDGITPDPLFLFHEDKKSLGVTVDVVYQSSLSFGFSYNSFFGGVGNINQMADRDYVSFNVKYSL